MARTADHAARRREMTDAVRSLLAEDGFEAVTVAHVARRSGVSVGLVQHYFPSKDELLLTAYRTTLADVAARVAGIVADGEARAQPIRLILGRALREHLPLDRTRRTDHAVRLALLVRGTTGAPARELAADYLRSLRTQVEQATVNGRECGEVDRDTDPEAAGQELVALITGMADQLFVDDSQALADAGLGALDAAVRRVFANTCRHYQSI